MIEALNIDSLWLLKKIAYMSLGRIKVKGGVIFIVMSCRTLKMYVYSLMLTTELSVKTRKTFEQFM